MPNVIDHCSKCGVAVSVPFAEAGSPTLTCKDCGGSSVGAKQGEPRILFEVGGYCARHKATGDAAAILEVYKTPNGRIMYKVKCGGKTFGVYQEDLEPF